MAEAAGHCLYRWAEHLSAAQTALFGYVAPPLPIRVQLFTAQGNDSREGLPFLGWDAVVPASHISSTPVAGRHDQLLSVSAFFGLAAALGDDWTVQGLQPRGLEVEEVPFSRVESAARAHLAVLEKERNSRPVHLIGHSFGGWIAFEMARQLAAAGTPPMSLTIVDSRAPGTFVPEYDEFDALLRLAQLYELGSGRKLSIHRSDLERLTPPERVGLLHDRLVEAAILPPRSSREDLARVFRCFAANLRTRYAPPVYNGPVELLIAREPWPESENVEALTRRWATQAPRLSVQVLEGNHVSVLKAPHVSDIAASLKRAAAQIQDWRSVIPS